MLNNFEKVNDNMTIKIDNLYYHLDGFPDNFNVYIGGIFWRNDESKGGRMTIYDEIRLN